MHWWRHEKYTFMCWKYKRSKEEGLNKMNKQIFVFEWKKRIFTCKCVNEYVFCNKVVLNICTLFWKKSISDHMWNCVFNFHFLSKLDKTSYCFKHNF
jgi:hypothetical protein